MPGGHEQAERQPQQGTTTTSERDLGLDPALGQGGDAATGQSSELQDPQVEFVDVFASFQLGAGVVLSSSTSRELRTTWGTTITLKASRESLQIFPSSPILIDAMWPAQNMEFYGLTVDFASGAISVDVSLVSGLGEGFLDYSENARSEIGALVAQGIAGTPMGAGGYDPFTDANLAGTLAAIQANFEALPGGGGESELDAGDLQNVAGGATLRMLAPFQQTSGDKGVRVPGGSQFTVRAQGSGSVADITAARDDQGRAEAVNLRNVQITDGEFQLFKGGETLAIIRSVSIDAGGNVQIGQFDLVGSAQSAAGAESLLRLLGAAAQLASRGVPGQAALHMASNSPDLDAEIVEGFARSEIDAGLTRAVHRLLAGNPYAIPGLDLRRIFDGG
ncbi:MAG: hypothetical protein H6704_14750 [Myxococcales bacterium]|nr:hypothetical protein [Myxococcales bacterium]MCB9537511.1 hypothetical protein [Myxococcales bacterium]